MARNKPPTLPEAFDVAVIRALEPLLRTPAAQAVGKVSEVGDQPPLLMLSGATLAAGMATRDQRLTRAGAGMVLAHLLATGVKIAAKNNIDRTRPAKLLEGDGYKMEPGSSKDPALRSFPSGHTAGAVAVACAVAREYPRARGWAYAAAGAIALLQIPRRAHFPTDILAGAAIGALAEKLVAWVIDDAVPQGTASDLASDAAVP